MKGGISQQEPLFHLCVQRLDDSLIHTEHNTQATDNRNLSHLGYTSPLLDKLKDIFTKFKDILTIFILDFSSLF